MYIAMAQDSEGEGESGGCSAGTWRVSEGGTKGISEAARPLYSY